MLVLVLDRLSPRALLLVQDHLPLQESWVLLWVLQEEFSVLPLSHLRPFSLLLTRIGNYSWNRAEKLNLERGGTTGKGSIIE